MQKVLVMGGGNIGSLITLLLSKSGYEIYLADIKFNTAEHAHLKSVLPNLSTVQLDVNDKTSMTKFLKTSHIDAIISSLPYFCTPAAVTLAKDFDVHYFDLTEDISSTKTVRELAKGAKKAFVPQCGLAPGLVGIIANNLMQHFDTIDTVKLRVGALPANSSDALHYALTWSTDGLINEYGNPCYGIEKHVAAISEPLEGLEMVEIDGVQYEAFNTSGGLGSLIETCAGKVNTLNYKTLRYPGHCEKMRFLMNDLKLNGDRKTLKNILEKALPKTHQDVVVMYISVSGVRECESMEENYVKKFYPQDIEGITWSAIQVTTAASVCAVVDRVLNAGKKYQGFILQEQFSLEEILGNPLGSYLR